MKSSHQAQAFPHDIFSVIAQFLNTNDIASIASTSKAINDTLNVELSKRILQEYSIKQICLSDLSHDQDAYFLDSKGDVWKCDLSLTRRNNVPQKMTQLPKIQSITIPSDTSVIFLSEAGEVWVKGGNFTGALGNAPGSILNYYLSPCRLELPKIIQVDGGHGCSFFLDENGMVWCCGNNLYGNLGICNTFEKITTPAPIKGLPKIVKIIAGMHFTFFLDEIGDVWVSGSETGLENFNKASMPIKIAGLSTIKDIALYDVGPPRAFFINQSGDVFAYGNNSLGQLGVGHRAKETVPVAIPTLSKIEKIVCNHELTFFIDTNKELYVSGTIMKNDTYMTYPDPFKVLGLENIKDIIVNHSYVGGAIILNEEGKAWMWSDLMDYRDFDLSGPCTDFPTLLNNFGLVNNAFMHLNTVIFIDKEGNVRKSKTSSKNELYAFKNMNKSYNFMMNHHVDTIVNRHIPLRTLLNYAIVHDKNNENKIFFDAVINLLRTQDYIIRFCELALLKFSPWFDAKIQAEFLFTCLPFDSFTCTIPGINQAILSIYKVIYQLYNCLQSSFKEGASKSDENNVNDFIFIMTEINKNTLCNKEQLKEILLSNTPFVNTRSFMFFSLTIAIPTLFDQYASLRQDLLKVADNDDMLPVLKYAVCFFIEMVNAFEGENVFLQRLKTKFQSMQQNLSHNIG